MPAAAAIETLRNLWQRLQRDASALKALQARDEQRKKLAPPLLAFLDSFLTGEIDVEQLKREFDGRTRKEWDGFGLKGMSGAMLLNKLVNHLSGQRKDLGDELRRALRFPETYEQGFAQMSDLLRWIDGLIASGVTSRADVQPKRIPYLLSTLWYVRAPEAWPAYYESVRNRLEELGLFEQGDDVTESYKSFVEVVRSTTKKLGLTPWQFEFLCDYSEPSGAPAPTPESRATRVWLWAAGSQADQWHVFQREGIASLGFGSERDLHDFQSLEEVRSWLMEKRNDGKRPFNDALAAWQIANDVRVGDTVYVKKGRSLVIGRGVVTAAYRFEAARKPFPHLCMVRWEWSGTADAGELLVMKTLTDISDYAELVARLTRLTRADVATSEAAASEEEETVVRIRGLRPGVPADTGRRLRESERPIPRAV